MSEKGEKTKTACRQKDAASSTMMMIRRTFVKLLTSLLVVGSAANSITANAFYTADIVPDSARHQPSALLQKLHRADITTTTTTTEVLTIGTSVRRNSRSRKAKAQVPQRDPITVNDTLEEEERNTQNANSKIDVEALPWKMEPVQTGKFQRRRDLVGEATTDDATNTITWKPTVPLPVKTRAFERILEDDAGEDPDLNGTTTWKRPVPLPVKSRSFERHLEKGDTTLKAWKPPVPRPVKTRAFERKLGRDEDTNQSVTILTELEPRPVNIIAPDTNLLIKERNYREEGKLLSVDEEHQPKQQQHRRRLGQQKVMPTVAQSLRPSPPPTKVPSGPPSSSPTQFPSSGPSLTPTANPSTRQTLAPVLSKIAPTAAPVVPKIAAPSAAPVVSKGAPSAPHIRTTSAPSKSPIRTTSAPSKSPIQAPATRTLPPSIVNEVTQTVALSNFDVLISANTSSAVGTEQEKRLLLYRRELRTSLQNYLMDSLTYNDLLSVQLHVVPRSQLRHRLQTSGGTIVNQVYSYAGNAVFNQTAPNALDVDRQAQDALANTSAVQAVVDQSTLLLQGNVTVQSIEIWTNDTTVQAPAAGQSNKSSKNYYTILGGLVAGVIILALLLFIIVYRRIRSKDYPPPPLITTSIRRPPVPFSPYGKEDDIHEDTKRMVEDIESLEESLREGADDYSPPRLYLQLTTSGCTSAEGESPRGEANSSSASGTDQDEILDDEKKDNAVVAAKKEQAGKRKDEIASLYSSPLMSIDTSHDSMEGFSLPSGNISDAIRGTPHDREQAMKPSWMISPKTATLDQSADDYSSDSESQFSHLNCEAGPVTAESTLGKGLLDSMSIGSADSFFGEDDELILSLDQKGGIVAESPSFVKKPPDQHYYPQESTPVMANSGLKSALRYNSSVPFAHDESSDEKDDPLRAAAMSSPDSLAYKNISVESSGASSGAITPKVAKVLDDEFSDDDDDQLRIAALSPPMNSSYKNVTVLSRELRPKSTKGCAGTATENSYAESLPSDEMMEDSMAQNLDGFAEELEQVQRNVGLPARINPLAMTTAPTAGRHLQDAPFDEFGVPWVTPDNATKRVMMNRSRR